MSLAGKHIVNTRALHQAAEFDALLRDAGAIPLSYPCIAIVPPEDTRALDAALASEFDLLLLTSANTVMSLAERLEALDLSLNGVKAAVVGAATAQSARELLGVEIAVIPDDYSAEGLADALTVTPGMRVLLPQSAISGDGLFSALMIRGADVSRVTAYRTIRGCGGVALAPLLQRGEVDAVTFTSASTARFFAERLREESAEIGNLPLISIGAQTSQALRELGLKVTFEAGKHTLGGLIDGLTTTFEEYP